MAIAKVEALRVHWGRHHSAWVRVTDDSGPFGMGEASPMGEGRAALEIVSSLLAPMLVGADPLDQAVLQERMYHRHIKLGPDGALAAALAAVDIALWDLKGKLLGQPIHRLLGGAWRTRMPFYASIGGNAGRGAEDACRIVERWLPLRPALVKIRLDADRTARDQDIPGDIARIRAVRRLLGDDFPLAFDANNNYSVQGAIRVGRILEDLGCAWFEEPVQHYDLASFAKVARALDIAVAAGEQEYTLQGVQRLIDAGVEIVQPDIVKTGGFTGLLQMAAVARAHGVDMVPHQTQPTIGHTANLHFCAALAQGHHPCEWADASGAQDAVLRTAVRPVDGCFPLGDRPGLGLELDMEALERRATPWAST
jgi:L-alanine-DL-glutamate epimerase-like enolase superfamily enzyme